ncbi:MAG: rhodanese-like domain-containing protein [Desulfovibrionaceae bacterium]|nr:rhodanese-like domain-containing protein [Desulfovibrionaceae bacterium]
MRWLVFLAAALCVGLPVQAEVIDVDISEVAKLAASGVVVVDIRRAEEWRETGVIKGSKRLTYVDAWGRVDPQWLEKMKAIAPPGQPVVLLCRSGARSAAAAKQLDEAGYKKVYNAKGGILAWLGAGQPVAPPDGSQ